MGGVWAASLSCACCMCCWWWMGSIDGCDPRPQPPPTTTNTRTHTQTHIQMDRIEATYWQRLRSLRAVDDMIESLGGYNKVLGA
jgi:hypothetical protein